MNFASNMACNEGTILIRTLLVTWHAMKVQFSCYHVSSDILL